MDISGRASAIAAFDAEGGGWTLTMRDEPRFLVGRARTHRVCNTTYSIAFFRTKKMLKLLSTIVFLSGQSNYMTTLVVLSTSISLRQQPIFVLDNRPEPQSTMETEDGSPTGGGAVDAASSDVATPPRQSVQSTRPDYFQNLRRGSTKTNLRLEGQDNDDDADAVHHQDSPSAPNPATDVENVSVNELRRRTSLKYLGETAARTQRVEVRLKDYSYHVPVRVDAPSINTALNTSPCYVATNVLKNVGEYISGKRKVSNKDIRGVTDLISIVYIWLLYYLIAFLLF